MTAALVLGLTLAGCSSSSTTSDATSAAASAAGSAAASAAPSGAVSSGAASAPASAAASSGASAAASPAASGPDFSQTKDPQWCGDYYVIAQALSNATNSSDDASRAIVAVKAFDGLWQQGVDRGYFSVEQVAANKAALTAYSDILQLLVGGTATDSAEFTKAQAALQAVTTKNKAPLQATDTKVAELCTPPGAASAGASAGASAVPSPSSS